MATINDIALKLGISKGTVSRALRQDPSLKISDDTRKKIFITAEEMNYVVKKEKLLSYVTRITVVHKQSHFLNQIDNAFYFSIRYGIEQTCLENKVQYSFIPYEYLDDSSIDSGGVIIIGGFTKAQMEHIKDVVNGRPCVYVGIYNFFRHEFDWITSDVESSVYTAMDELIAAGCKKVMFLGGKHLPDIPDRFKKVYQYTNYVQRHPELTSIAIVEGEHGSESGYLMMKEWLQSHNELPDGIYVSNDPIAIGAIRALNEYNIHIPDDVCIISQNGDSHGAMTSPPLDSVDNHTTEMGREAVRLLLERINEKNYLRKTIWFEETYIPRESVRKSL